ncbi:MAG TPA: hypothetical protein VKU80_07225, partial [Planctomycetota bacterium]|nr:hypothetical protein [Planctomycetota bacterium]
RAGVYAHFGSPAEAAQNAQHATSLAPKAAWALLARAAVLDELGKDAEALADYDEACRLSPKSVSARLQRCFALVNHGKDRQGLDEAEDILKNLDPTSLQGIIARAYARIRSRDIETVKAAVQDCTQAHQAAPDHEDPLRERSDAWHALAYLYEDQRKPADGAPANTLEEQAYSHATDDIKEAKERNERSPIVRVFEGSLFLSMGRGKERKKDTAAAEQYYKRAKEAFEEAKRRNPNYLFALLSLAQAESLLGDNPGAFRTCEEARGKYPNRFDAYETIANMEFGLAEKAFDANQALAAADERRRHLEKARGQFEEARKRAADSNAVRIGRRIRYVKLWEDLFEATVLYFQKDYSSSRRRLRQADQALEEFPQQKTWRDSLDRPLKRVGQ